MPTWNHRSMDVSTVSRANRRTSPLAVAISNSMPRIRYNASILTASFVAIAFLTYATGADRPTPAIMTWSSWRLAPALFLILLLLAAHYINGIRRQGMNRSGLRRAGLFLSGLAVILFALD